MQKKVRTGNTEKVLGRRASKYNECQHKRNKSINNIKSKILEMESEKKTRYVLNDKKNTRR